MRFRYIAPETFYLSCSRAEYFISFYLIRRNRYISANSHVGCLLCALSTFTNGSCGSNIEWEMWFPVTQKSEMNQTLVIQKVKKSNVQWIFRVDILVDRLQCSFFFSHLVSRVNGVCVWLFVFLPISYIKYWLRIECETHLLCCTSLESIRFVRSAFGNYNQDRFSSCSQRKCLDPSRR